MLGQAWKPVNFLLLSVEGMMAVWVGGFIEPPHLVRKPQVTGAEITTGLWKNNGILKAARFTWDPFCFVFRCALKDFGEYQESYYSVQTTEGEQISQLIAGYIDIILKKARHHLQACWKDLPALHSTTRAILTMLWVVNVSHVVLTMLVVVNANHIVLTM